ncbi:MAG: hypothetical protein WCE61_08115 [Candidatus Acidiferrum sp.]
MDEPTADHAQVSVEQRRGTRFPVVVFVEAKWHGPGGEGLQETAQAMEVSAVGGLLDMRTFPGVGCQMELTNLVSRDKTAARVIGTRRSKDGISRRVAVELLTPSETFWGLNFQLRKTSSELVKIEQAIKSGGVDPRILEEFRDSVDYVRKTAWAVQEWQEREMQKHDTRTVIPLITSERIRRATQMSKAILTDLTNHDVTRETAGLEDFSRTIESLHQRVTELFRNR